MRGPGDGSPALPGETSMKKQAKKLVLAKETVRSLETANLLKAAGGTYAQGGCGNPTPSVPPVNCDEGYITQVGC